LISFQVRCWRGPNFLAQAETLISSGGPQRRNHFDLYNQVKAAFEGGPRHGLKRKTRPPVFRLNLPDSPGWALSTPEMLNLLEAPTAQVGFIRAKAGLAGR